ncbi:MAG TPA: NAD(+)/NADH kinase [Myxococcales bacterium]|nr:NAD(+)/NADH kinase [Myxococcales bacterium]
MKTIALVAKRGKADAVELARQLAGRYADRAFLAERHLARAVGWPVPEDDRQMVAQADLVIVLGGDGTMLHAARLLGTSPAPIMGVNLGSLGFTTEVPPEELFQRLDEVFAGRHRVEERMKLSCTLLRGGAAVLEEDVLNDVVLSKGALARIADHEMLIDGEYVTTYKADGVIISTPTGSTAYSLSAGGPIVHPSMECVVVSPICSHALTQRALVVNAERVITLVLKGDTADVFLTMDGQVGRPLESGDRVEVRRSPGRFRLIRNPAMSYFQVLRQKLHWGER